MRFPGFEGEWEHKKLARIVEFKVTNSFSRENLNYEAGAVKNIHYGDIHTKFQTIFDITRENVPYVNGQISLSRISDDFYCKEGDIIFADASEDLKDVGKSIEIANLNGEKVLSGLHTLLARPKTNHFQKGFSGYLFRSTNVRLQIQKEAQGSKVLSINVGRLSNITLSIPTIPEQKKIAEFLSLIDERIATQNKIINSLETLIKGLNEKLLIQEIRFKDKNGTDFPEWEKHALRELLHYDQPTKYLVSSTEYDDSYDVPVLTAGKTFILGYSNETHGIFSENLPVIIFDDFTTALKFVDFPFKVKSSAMKILRPKKGVNIYYVFEAMKSIEYNIGGHERHWISKYSKIEIPAPCSEEQTKIANFLLRVAEKIETERGILIGYQHQKQFLLASLFI